jgi:hypothetical protein
LSEKRMVPTFHMVLAGSHEHADKTTYHGPIVSPNMQEAATHLSKVHDICFRYQSCLIYDHKWHLVNWSHIVEFTKGSKLFPLPWPLRDPDQTDQSDI